MLQKTRKVGLFVWKGILKRHHCRLKFIATLKIHVGNSPSIHRNPRQFTWCSFIHSTESQSHSFLNSLTHRYFRRNKLVFDSEIVSPRLPQYTWNLTYVIIKWLTFSIISTILIKKPKYLISYQSSPRDCSLNLSEIMSWLFSNQRCHQLDI